jgi:hypothetical protein
MLPLIATRMELDLVKARIDHAAAAVAKKGPRLRSGGQSSGQRESRENDQRRYRHFRRNIL